MPRGIAATPACAVAGALLLGACASGGAAPVVLRSRAAAPAAQVAAAAASFPLTAQGAAAFARDFLATLDRAYLTGDLTRLERAVRPECDTCRRMLAALRRTYGAGGRYTGGRTTVVFAEAPQVVDGRTTVDLIYDYAELVRLDRSGRVVAREAARRTEAALDLVATEDGWVVAAYRRIR